MALLVFYRSNYSQLWLNLQSNEALGVLDTGYIEDYNGDDGQISLFHVASGVRYSVPVVEIPSQSPETPNDYFRGSYSLASLPDGDYLVQARVRDQVGNYTVLSGVASPFGTERVIPLTLRIMAGFAVKSTVEVGPLTARGAIWIIASRLIERIVASRIAERVRVRRNTATVTLT